MHDESTTLADQLHTLLVDEGYGKVRFDDDGDVVFKCEGLTYLALFDERDPRYVRLVLPGFWSIDDEEERERAIEVCNHVHGTCKCAYVRVGDDAASAAVEVLMPPGAAFDGPYVRRLISMIVTAVDTFREKMLGKTLES